ncbi:MULTISPECIES: YjcZ family sporulation protein [Bacillaceae]|uniref:YjcZ family sporulation protein n=1 Tax=Bacillaceae TaxID=186817 RepID=UPI0009E7E5F7|nr:MULTISPECIES: YjcZ family sporulation protein [Bacillaceae]MDF2066115.1 YjcZ family sporulation protein [Bacillus sp. Cr_A10]
MGYDCYPCYGYGYGPEYNRPYGSGFALIVVLFILLIIIGASFVNHGRYGGDDC